MTIFISHSSKDEKYLKKIVSELKEYNLDYWISEEYIKPNEKTVYQKLRNQVNMSDVYILIWSENSQESIFVRDEINWMTEEQNKTKQNFIFKIINSKEIPPHYGDPYYFRLESPDDIRFQEYLKKIINEIRQELD